jgi:hypothetical protein
MYNRRDKEKYFFDLLPKRKHIAINKRTINKLIDGEMKVFF